MTRRRPAVPFFISLAAPAAPAALAAEWSAAPSLSWTTDTNSNRRLDFVARGSESLQLEGSLALRRKMETLDIALTPHFSVYRYRGESVLDSNDFGLAVDVGRTGELTTLNLQASASRDGTLTSELRDTGIIEGRQQRQAIVGTLSVSRAFAARVSVSASAGWQGIRYQNAAASGLVDYSYPNAAAAATWLYSPTTKLSLRMDASELRAPDIALTSRSHSERLVAESQLSDRWNWSLALGQSATSARSASDSGPVYTASVRWTGVLTQFSLSAGRDVAPTGRGVLVTRDDLSGSFSRRLSERWSLSANASYDRNEDLLLGFIRNNRRYWSGDAAINWRVTDTWTLSTRLSAAQASFDVIDTRATSRGAALVFAWSPYQRTISR